MPISPRFEEEEHDRREALEYVGVHEMDFHFIGCAFGTIMLRNSVVGGEDCGV